MGNQFLKPVETWLKLSVLPPIGAAIIRGLGRSMRIESQGQEHVDALYRDGRNIILAFWHAQQLMIPVGYRGPGAHVLISQHQDHCQIRASGGAWVQHQRRHVGVA